MHHQRTRSILIALLVLFTGTQVSFLSGPWPIRGTQPKPNPPVKHIYLTFDDGPLQGSDNIDSIVFAEKLKISVFLVGRNLEKKELGAYYKLYRQNPYVESYNHSYSHANNQYARFYTNPLNVLADIQKNQALLNLPYKIARLPGRNMWRLKSRKRDDEKSGSAAADLLAVNGYRIFGWDFEWQHKSPGGEPVQTVDQVYAEINARLDNRKTFTKDHIVILLHDEMFQKKWEESELRQLLDKLRAHGNYVFEHIRFYPD